MTMENYLSRLTEPYVGEVKVPDFNQIRQNALATAAAEGQFQDQEYKRYSRNYLNGLLANNPNASGDEIGNALARGGVGAEAIPYQYNWLNQQASKLKFESDLRKEAANVFSMLDSAEGVGRAVDHFNKMFPGYDWEQFRFMPPEQVRQKASGLFDAKDRASLQHTQASTQATINQDARAANQDARAASEENRRAALFPGQTEAQGLENQGRSLSNQEKQTALDAVEEGYALPGGRFLGTRDMLKAYHEAKANNFSPDFTFESFASGLRPATRNKKSGKISVDEAQTPAAPQGQTPQDGQAPGAQTQQGAQVSKSDALNQARAAIARGADRNTVIARLKGFGLTDDEIMQGVR